MSLPYLNENKSRQTQMSHQFNPNLHSGKNRPRDPMNMIVPEESRTLDLRPVSNPSQRRNRDAASGSRRSNAPPQPQQFSVHSDVINRMNSDGSTVSEIHHHVHHHYNHTHIHHHHGADGATTSGQATPFIMAGGAAVPSAGVSTHHLDSNNNLGANAPPQPYQDRT